jgi:CTP synthase (UTP-ammonia lyase)
MAATRRGRYRPDPVASALRVGVIGDQVARFVPQEAMADALAHSADRVGCDVELTWFATPSLERDAESVLAGCDALWCAPGGPYRSLDGALEGIRVARETARPFLGTCAGFQHGVLECARNLLGMRGAGHPEYGGDSPDDPLILDERLCSLVGQEMRVRLVDPATRSLYGTDEVAERYYCRFALAEHHRDRLASVGLVVAGIDEIDGGTRILRRLDCDFFYLTLFVPQVASRPDAPHPLVTAFVEAAAGSAPTVAACTSTS